MARSLTPDRPEPELEPADLHDSDSSSVSSSHESWPDDIVELNEVLFDDEMWLDDQRESQDFRNRMFHQAPATCYPEVRNGTLQLLTAVEAGVPDELDIMSWNTEHGIDEDATNFQQLVEWRQPA